jgi:arylformamidase
MPKQKPIWSNLTTEEHEFQYNPQNAFPDFQDARLKRAPFNEAVHRDLAVSADISYGDHPLRTLDVYPAQNTSGPAPVHVFLHGGYWRAQDKANFGFIPGILVPRGITTVVINYELCPDSTLDGVVDSAIAAMAWVFDHIQDHGGNPHHVTISGHSAGAHLGAEILAHEWAERHRGRVLGGLFSSGLFDPAPAILTSVNAQLHLNADIAERHNVEDRKPVLTPDLSIIVGSREPWQWVDQSFRYYRNLRQFGLEPALHVLTSYSHFDILDEYLDVDSVTVRTILKHCGITKS